MNYKNYFKSFKLPNKIKILGIFLITILIVLNSSLSYSQNEQTNTDFDLLRKKLISYNFTVKLEIPPHTNKYGIKPYGLLEGETKTIWINPVVFELENAEATIVHEATHAAQLCAGKTEFKTLKLDIDPPRITHPSFMRYHNYRREIEAEAYTVQVQKNSLELANELLDLHCSSID